MKRFALTCLAAALLPAVEVRAHRLDELLQAARIGIERDRIDLELDLTPGINIARGFFDAVDGNRDGRLSAGEQDAYARDVISSLKLDVDGRTQTLALTSQKYRPYEEMIEGVGVIRLTAAARISGTFGWNHTLQLRNAHRPDVSVYLANALVPADPSVRIDRQDRDFTQRDIRITYTSGTAGRFVWPAVFATLIGVTISARLLPKKHHM